MDMTQSYAAAAWCMTVGLTLAAAVTALVAASKVLMRVADNMRYGPVQTTKNRNLDDSGREARVSRNAPDHGAVEVPLDFGETIDESMAVSGRDLDETEASFNGLMELIDKQDAESRRSQGRIPL